MIVSLPKCNDTTNVSLCQENILLFFKKMERWKDMGSNLYS